MFFKDDDKIKIRSESITTIISADTSIEGNIVSGNSIRLSGAVKGDIISKGLVIVTQGARVKGNITAESVLVAGSVEGNLQIVNKTNIEPSGEVIGDITTKRLLVDEESVFSGKCTMIRGDEEILARQADQASKEEKSGEDDSEKNPESIETSGTEGPGEASEIEFIDVGNYGPKKGRKKKQ